MGKSIYNITEEFYDLMAEIEEAEGIVEGELEERLAQMDIDVETKARNLFYYNRKLDDDITIINNEIQRLEQKLETVKKSKDNILKASKVLLKVFGKDNKAGNKEILYTDFKLVIRKSKSVDFDIEAENRLMSLILKNKLDTNELSSIDDVGTVNIKLILNPSEVKKLQEYAGDFIREDTKMEFKLSKSRLKPYAEGEIEDKYITEYIHPTIFENENVNFK